MGIAAHPAPGTISARRWLSGSDHVRVKRSSNLGTDNLPSQAGQPLLGSEPVSRLCRPTLSELSASSMALPATGVHTQAAIEQPAVARTPAKWPPPA